MCQVVGYVSGVGHVHINILYNDDTIWGISEVQFY